MTGFERGAIVRVPFPYTDRATRQHRPALVISDGAIGNDPALLWVMMVTSAENRPWPGDVAVEDHAACGLPAPSVIRTAKIMTIECADAEPRGTIGAARLAQVDAQVRRNLGWRG